MKHFFFIIALLYALYAIPATSHATKAPLRYRHFNNFSGRTTSMHVRSVTQLPSGMVWMGTTSGLFSFDGYDLRHYDNHENPTGIVFCLTPALEYVYMGCEKGLFAFDLKSHQVILLKKLNDVNVVIKHRNLLWLGTSKGLFSYSLATGKCEPIDEINNFVSSSILSLYAIDKTIYIGTMTEFCSYDMTDGSFRIIDGDIPMVTSIQRHIDGKNLWVGTGPTLFQYNPNNRKLSAIGSIPVVKTMEYDNKGNLLLGSDNGLYVIPATGGNARVVHDARSHNSLSSDVVWDIYKGDDGNIWLATDNGLSLSQDEDGIKVLPLPALTSSGCGNQIYSINMDPEGSLWAGGSNGVIKISDIEEEDPTSRWYQMNDTHSFLPHNRIRKIFLDSQGRLWIASDGGLLLHLPETTSFKRFLIKDNSYWIYDIGEDQDGNIWIASFSGVHCLGKNINEWDRQVSPVSSFTSDNGLYSDHITSIGFDKDGYLWVLSDRLPVKIDIREREIMKFNFGKNGNKIHSSVMTVDGEGSVWATDGEVIYKLSSLRDDMTPESVTLHSSSSVEALAMTDVGKEIWITTSNGIVSVDKNSFTTAFFATSKRFTSIYKAPDGKIWLGSDDQMVEIINSKDLKSINSTLSVTEVKVNGSASLSDAVLETGEIILPHDENTLEISFSDFSFGEVKFSTLMFKLDGAMSDWIKIDAGQNQISLPSLSPGTYKLYIAHAGMTKLSKPVLSIVIDQPWFLTTLAKCLYALAIILAVFWTIYFIMLRQRLESERRERERIMEQGNSKVNFISNISHEFKTPLNIVITSLSKLMKTRTDSSEKELLGKAKINADKINSLLRMMSEAYQENDNFSSLSIPSKFDITELSTSIFDICHEQFKDKGLILKSNTPESPLYVNADPFKIESIICNLLSNACKYTLSGGTVELAVSVENSMLKITVKDTGIGISKKDIPHIFRRYFRSKEAINMEMEGSGIGLSTVKEYVELHHGTIRVESGEYGSLFTVLMPILLNFDSIATHGQPAIKRTWENSKTSDGCPDKPLVAVIDDSDQTVEFISNLLKDKYRCATASNGKSGLKLCLDLHPDIIVTDLAMPVMDGLQMCARLRSHPSMATVPIIMLTGKNSPDSELKSLKLKVDSFFEKPFDHLLFIAKIDQLLDCRKRIVQQARIQSISTTSSEKIISSDEKLLHNIIRLIEQEISNPDFSVEMLSEKSGIGEKQLYRKIKSLTELSPSEYIRSIRLKKARMILTQNGFSIKEAMYMVGFSNASYFTRCFKKEFGVTPMEYQSSHRNK